jgi:putative hemolysin
MDHTPLFDVLTVEKGELLEQAFALRHKVFFNKEGKDKDAFDDLCRHIVVIEPTLGKVIGTYRLLLGSAAKGACGFYSETEFDLTNLKKNCTGELLEMGRACVDPAYRKYPILNFMWKTITDYMQAHKVAYVLGCASVEEPTAETIGKIYVFLKNNVFAPQYLAVPPLKGKEYPYDRTITHCEKREALRLLPALIKNYVKIGAFACGEPVWDKTFNTADFFMLLEVSRANLSYLSKFL